MKKSRIEKAAEIINSGGVVAFPTETVFGIGASINFPAAIRRIYKLKKRPKNKPLQILVPSLEAAKKLGKFNPKALELAKKNWPGPLTFVVFKKNRSLKIGLRVPAHKTTLALLQKTGPLAATSANLAGKKPALTVREVKNSLPTIDYILPGRVKLKIASKVIDVTRKPKILRL